MNKKIDEMPIPDLRGGIVNRGDGTIYTSDEHGHIYAVPPGQDPMEYIRRQKERQTTAKNRDSVNEWLRKEAKTIMDKYAGHDSTDATRYALGGALGGRTMADKYKVPGPSNIHACDPTSSIDPDFNVPKTHISEYLDLDYDTYEDFINRKIT